ncbi:MAG: IS1 family transposase [Plectolyngbya sp. WJT66-NPBG17]|jgi:transposase-like protein|nr:IS1 family transposase [Plectolyngbya sp. WJT66-NPBG17]MBW4528485.1 IS1 family transposase [Phormidium tanganyikae FI6-MK23]
MNCPQCSSTHINKNGHCRGKQNYRCKVCGRQFVESRSTKGYSEDAKQICLKMYRDGVGFRAIGRATGISHNTIINWVKQTEAEQSEPDEQDRQIEQHPYKSVQSSESAHLCSSNLLKKISY